MITTFSKETLKNIFDIEKCYANNLSVPQFPDLDKVPTLDKDYVFDDDTVNQVLLFLAQPFNDCLFLSGSSGCGKTTMILQVASRLGYAVEQITASAKTEIQDLIGHPVLRKGSITFEYGALTKAMLNGEILLINEIDMLGAGELSGLNDILEGKPLTIVANNGEVIKPHPNFRVVATGNTKGNGDNTGRYLGARVLNQAFLDRWRFLECDYPTSNIEKKILHKACPNISDDDLKNFMQLATEIRRVCENGGESINSDLSAPFSTRTLLRIAHLYESVDEFKIEDAVFNGFSSRLPTIEQDFILRLVKDIFGHEHVKSLVDDIEKKIVRVDNSVETTSLDEKLG